MCLNYVVASDIWRANECRRIWFLIDKHESVPLTTLVETKLWLLLIPNQEEFAKCKKVADNMAKLALAMGGKYSFTFNFIWVGGNIKWDTWDMIILKPDIKDFDSMVID